MNLVRAHRVTGHLSMPFEACGVMLLALAFVNRQVPLGQLALTLFILAALSELAAYRTGESIDEAGDERWDDEVGLLVLRHDDAVFVAMVLACALAVMAVVWLATYAWAALPAEVAWFAATMALFVSLAMVYAAHLDDRLRQRQSRQPGPLSTPTVSHHAS
jgi:hypothetical protein